jgi:NTE family protein
VLAEAGYRFPRSAGTSAGAIAAVPVAAIGKSGQDMAVLSEYLHDIDYTQFMRTGPVRHLFDRLGPAASACELIFRPGLYSGDYLNSWLGGKLRDCGVSSWADLTITPADDPDPSLAPGQRYRAVVHVSDISRGMLARLPWDYPGYYGLPADDQEVVSAVRASISSRPARCASGPGAQPADVPAGSTLAEGMHRLKTMTGEWDRYRVGQATAERTIFVPNAGTTATQFNLSPAQQQTLFLNGARAATSFLIRWAGAGGVPRSARTAVTA